MIKKHGRTSFPKHDYFLFQEILTQEKIWFMLQFVPCFYSYLFLFLPKPPFQVFNLGDIFLFFFIFMLRDLLTVSLGHVAPFMLVLHGIKEVGFTMKM